MAKSGKTPKAPETIAVDFISANGEPIELIDLGPDFLTANGIEASEAKRPFRVAIQKKESKAGNAFYDYSQNSISFPNGLTTLIRVEGTIVPMGKTRPSKKGYPTREGVADVIVGGVVYKVTAYLTEGKTPFYVKIIAHKKPEASGEGLKKAQKMPRGGTII